METAKVHTKSKHKSAKSSGKKMAVNVPRSDDVEPEVQPSASAANVISVEAVDEACNNNNNDNSNDSSDRNRINNVHNVDGDVVKAEAQPKQQQQQQQPPQPDAIIVTELTETKRTDEKLQKGILGYMDRQLKVQTILEPPRSPAQRSTRSSRSSQDKSPRRKRSKSESRRRRERKIIAAGEMEVRQANETLMRYLKQCSDFNDASLSGDLEINESVEDRRVQRKTKSQREKKAHYPSRANGKHQSNDITTVLNELSDDVIHQNGEIYNPFTPVVSPMEGPPARIDKMYIQTSSGYRPVDNNNYFKSPIDGDPESNKRIIKSGVHLSCAIQRVWFHISNICHGLLGGLALAHLLFICTTKPYDWSLEGSIRNYAAFAEIYSNTFYCLAIVCMVSIFDRLDVCHLHHLTNGNESISFRSIVLVMIYAATIILSLSAGSMDERLYLTYFNVTVWEEEMESNKILSIWNSLSIARSIGAIFGWIMVGLTQTEDLLYEHLLDMEKYQIN